MKSNPEVKDSRQLPDWMKFDWNNPDDIEHPKKHRSQIRNRTSGSLAMHRPPRRERDLGEACGTAAQRMLAPMEADIVVAIFEGVALQNHIAVAIGAVVAYLRASSSEREVGQAPLHAPVHAPLNASVTVP